MYDLPSEAPEEPGLPDEYHDLQPQLLSRTLYLTHYVRGEWVTGSDLNLYYANIFRLVGINKTYAGQYLTCS